MTEPYHLAEHLLNGPVVSGSNMGSLLEWNPLHIVWAALCEVGQSELVQHVGINRSGDPTWKGEQPAPEEVWEAFRLFHRAVNPQNVRCLKLEPFTADDTKVMSACRGCNLNGCP